MRMCELVEQARLANTRFSNYTNDLTMVCPGLFKCFSKLLGFSIAPDKASESARGCRLLAPTCQPGPSDLVHLHRCIHPLHIDRAKRLYLHVAFGQLHRICGHHDGPWHRHLFHASRQVRCLSNRCVVHLQVTSDGPHHDLS
jgi:hypothetical protein